MLLFFSCPPLVQGFSGFGVVVWLPWSLVFLTLGSYSFLALSVGPVEASTLSLGGAPLALKNSFRLMLFSITKVNSSPYMSPYMSSIGGGVYPTILFFSSTMFFSYSKHCWLIVVVPAWSLLSVYSNGVCAVVTLWSAGLDACCGTLGVVVRRAPRCIVVLAEGWWAAGGEWRRVVVVVAWRVAGDVWRWVAGDVWRWVAGDEGRWVVVGEWRRVVGVEWRRVVSGATDVLIKFSVVVRPFWSRS